MHSNSMLPRQIHQGSFSSHHTQKYLGNNVDPHFSVHVSMVCACPTHTQSSPFYTQRTCSCQAIMLSEIFIVSMAFFFPHLCSWIRSEPNSYQELHLGTNNLSFKYNKTTIIIIQTAHHRTRLNAHFYKFCFKIKAYKLVRNIRG